MSRALEAIAGRLDLPQAGVLWVSLVIFLVVLVDSRRPWSYRNAAIVALWLPMVAFVDYVGMPRRDIAPHVFALIYVLTAAYVLWCAQIALRPRTVDWAPNLPRRNLLLLLAIVLAMDAAMVFGLKPDDAGRYTNLGARRWMETGTIPYADPLLKGPDSPAFGAAATYGPLLYVAHMPFQILVGAESNPADLDPMDRQYVRPPVLATQMVCFGFFLLGAFAVFRCISELKDQHTALAAVTIYGAHPMIMGLGGHDYRAGGLAYVSHFAPSALVLTAFMLRRRPILSGLLLAAGAGLLFWPAFLFPLWLGWWFWRDRRSSLRFAAGFAIGGALILALVVLAARGSDESPVRLFLESTLEHQEGSGEREYGASRHSFWGTHPRVASIFHTPLFGTTSLFKPTFLAFAALCFAAAFWVRNKGAAQFAALIAMLASGIQLWKTHANGTYVGWYLGLLLIGLLCAGADREPPAKLADT